MIESATCGTSTIQDFCLWDLKYIRVSSSKSNRCRKISITIQLFSCARFDLGLPQPAESRFYSTRTRTEEKFGPDSIGCVTIACCLGNAVANTLLITGSYSLLRCHQFAFLR